MNYKKLFVIIIFTFLIGVIPSILIGSNLDGVVLPSLFPPKILFPIVWTILYVLMSISVYLASINDNSSYVPYLIQLLFNSTWTIIFFGLRWFLLGVVWILIIIGIVFYMIIKYSKKNKIASYLLIPYLFWLFIALYLNVSIFILN